MQDLTSPASCIGIIAGAGPDAGITFWRQVLATSRRRKGANYRGDLDAPRVRIISEPVLGYAIDIDANREELREALFEILAELDKTCNRIVFACHALQGLAQEANADVAARKLVSLPDLAHDFVQSGGYRKVGLLAAPSICADPESSPYSRLWSVTEVEKPKDPEAVLRLIMEAKKIGSNHPLVVKKLSSMISEYEADRVLLACTDFSGVEISAGDKTIVDVLELAAEYVTD